MPPSTPALRAIRWTAPVLSRVTPPLAVRWLTRIFITPNRRAVLAREMPWLEGATRSTVTTPGGEVLPVWSWGQGPVVLLVHGWSGRGSQMAAHVAPLVQKGFRVVTWDMPGHGDAGGKYSGLLHFTPALEAVAATLPPVHGVVAHSLGTAAVSVALSRGLQARRLVYLAPPEDLPRYVDKVARFLHFSPAVGHGTLRLLEKRYHFLFDQLRGQALAPAMTTPLLVIHDHEDRDAPLAEGRLIARLWPGAQLMETRGKGHTRLVRDPEVLAAAAHFLESGVVDLK